MSNFEMDRLSHLVESCERQINHLERELGSKKRGVCKKRNPLYGLKHCLHTINIETDRLDNAYAACLLKAKNSAQVRSCFGLLKKNLSEFNNSYRRECNISDCKVSNISGQALSCCIHAKNLGDLNTCFERMIISPLSST